MRWLEVINRFLMEYPIVSVQCKVKVKLQNKNPRSKPQTAFVHSPVHFLLALSYELLTHLHFILSCILLFLK